MANWEDIMSNQLTMGRSRWLCYTANAQRRQREDKEGERRPGPRPLVGRGVRPKPPRFLQWEGLWGEISRGLCKEGEVGQLLHQGHFFKFIIHMCPIACHTAQQLDLVMWTPTFCVPLE